MKASASNSKCLWQKATTRLGCAAVHKLRRCIIHRSKAYSDTSCVCSYGWALPNRQMTRWMRLCGLILLTLSMCWCSKDWHEETAMLSLSLSLCVQFNVTIRPQRPYGLLGTSTSAFTQLLSSDSLSSSQPTSLSNAHTRARASGEENKPEPLRRAAHN